MKKIIILSIFLIHTAFSFGQENLDTLSHKGEAILEIGYHSTGSEMGGYITATLTRDSIIYKEDTQINKTEKNNTKKWSDLVSSINLNEFNKIVNAKPQSATDGIDVIIYIQTSKEKYSKLIDRNNCQTIKPFLKQLFKQLKYFNKDFNLNY